MELCDSCAAQLVAVDIASGVNSDTARLWVRQCELRLPYLWLCQYGHVSYPGAGYCGELKIVDIGFPAAAVADVMPHGRYLETADVRPLMHPRAPDSHKGTYGHPLIIAGGLGKGGAALLASRAALRIGAGLVTTAIPACVAVVVASGQAELMTEPMPDVDGHFAATETIARLRDLVARKTALVIGPESESAMIPNR